MAGSRSGELRPVGISENWGEGAVVSHPESPVAVYYRFYEWNLFGAVRPGLHTQADKNQRVEATWEAESGLIEYPEQGVALTLEPADRGVDLALTVENHSDRDWPALAALVSCLNPGRQGGDPKQSALADREIHWHEDYHDRVRRRRPDGGGRWSTGIAWEDALAAQGHNPWWCLHLGAAVGPLEAGERRTLAGKLYLLEGGAERVLAAYEREFR